MSSGKTKKRRFFETLVDRIEVDGPLEATVLASAFPYEATTTAQRAARQIIGAVAPGGTAKTRIDRLAALIDDLCAADAESVEKAVANRSKRPARAGAGATQRVRHAS
jgi:hypothetical protein